MNWYIKITIEAKRAEGTTLFKASFLLDYAKNIKQAFQEEFTNPFREALKACHRDAKEHYEVWNESNKEKKKDDSGSS